MKGNITTKVPAELESAASNGVVVSSDGVYDYKKGKFQEDVNEGVSDDISAIKGGSNKSLAQIDNQLQQIAAHDVISMAGGDVNVSTNGDDFSDASKTSYVPTIGSILGSMDSEPTEGSVKPVQSGGVYKDVNNIQNYIENTRIINNGSTEQYPGAILMTDYLPISKGDTVRWIYSNAGVFPVGFSIYDSNYQELSTWWGENNVKERTFTINYDAATYFRASFKDSDAYTPTVLINGNVVWTRLEDGAVVNLIKRKLDDVPTANSDNLVKSGGVYDAIEGVVDVVTDTKSRTTALENSAQKLTVLHFNGQGTTYSANTYAGLLQKGHTYRITMHDTDWSHTAVPTDPTAYLLNICYYKNSSRVALTSENIYFNIPVQKSYIFTVTDEDTDIDMFAFGGRADAGVTVYAVLEDLTEEYISRGTMWPRVLTKDDADIRGLFDGEGKSCRSGKSATYKILFKIDDNVRVFAGVYNSNYRTRTCLYNNFADALSSSNITPIGYGIPVTGANYNKYGYFRYGSSAVKKQYLGVEISNPGYTALTDEDITIIERDLAIEIHPLNAEEKYSNVEKENRLEWGSLTKDDFNFCVVNPIGSTVDGWPSRIKFIQELRSLSGEYRIRVNIDNVLTYIPDAVYAAYVYKDEDSALGSVTEGTIERPINGWNNASNEGIITSPGFLNIYFKKSTNTMFTQEEVKVLKDNVEIIVKKESNVSSEDFDLFPLGTLINTSDTLVQTDSKTCVPYLGLTYKAKLPATIQFRVLSGNDYNNLVGSNYIQNNGSLSLPVTGMVHILEFANIDETALSASYVSELVAKGDIQILYKKSDLPVKERNYEAETYVKSAMYRVVWPNITERTAGKCLSSFPLIVHISDLHGDFKRFENCVEYAHLIGADATVITGDSVLYVSSDKSTYLKDVLDKHPGIPALVCMGNHECYPSNTYDNAYMFDNHVAPLVEQGGYLATVGTPTTLPYYYVDFDAKKLRIISLNQFDNGCYYGQNLGGRLGQTQVTWFCNTLLSTPAGYGVVIMMHSNEDKVNTPSEMSNWNQTVNWDGSNEDITGYAVNGLYVNAIRPIKVIVDAFISRTALVTSYNENTVNGNNGETVSIDVDFSEVAEDVEFICYMSGHRHKDNVGYINGTTNRQLMLNIVTGNCHYPNTGNVSTLSFAEGSDVPRGDRGVTQDAFNVYAIDRVRGIVKIARVGSSVNFEGIERKFLVAAYK